GGVERPIATPSQRLIGGRRDIALDIVAGCGAALDLGHGSLGIVLADRDRGLEAWLGFAPAFDLPLVDSALQCAGELLVLLREDEQVEHLQNSELDVDGVEVLPAHKGKVGARWTTGGRPGVTPREQW